MSEEYDLKESEATIGQLSPVIKDAKGRIVDGLHRTEANPKWKTETWNQIKTDEDYWKARAHLNYTRRNAQEAREEKLNIVNNLADYYLKQGLRVAGRKPETGHGDGSHCNEVLDAVIKALRGAISESWIRHNIDRKFRQEQNVREEEKEKEEIKKHNEQVFDNLKKVLLNMDPDTFKPNPEIMKKAAHRIIHSLIKEHGLPSEDIEQTKKELMKDTSFIADVITSAPEILKELPKASPLEPEPVFPALTPEQAEKMKEAFKEADRELEEKRKDPKLIARSILVKNWMAHAEIDGISQSLSCPECGASTENLVWKCHNIPVAEAEKMLKQKLEGK